MATFVGTTRDIDVTPEIRYRPFDYVTMRHLFSIIHDAIYY